MAQHQTSSSGIQRPMTCPVCLELYDTEAHVPRILPCHHTICHECLVKMGSNEATIQCPMDMSSHKVPRGGLFPINFTVRDVAEEMQKQLMGDQPTVKYDAKSGNGRLKERVATESQSTNVVASGSSPKSPSSSDEYSVFLVPRSLSPLIFSSGSSLQPSTPPNLLRSRSPSPTYAPVFNFPVFNSYSPFSFGSSSPTPLSRSPSLPSFFQSPSPLCSGPISPFFGSHFVQSSDTDRDDAMDCD